MSVNLHVDCNYSLGVPQELIQRAEYISECIRNHEPITPIDRPAENKAAMDNLIHYFGKFDCEKGRTVIWSSIRYKVLGPIDEFMKLLQATREE